MGLPWGCGRPSLIGHARGLLTSLVTLLLLQLGSAQLRVEGPGHTVTATVGQDVVLPCHLSPQRDARSLEVKWIRDSISETVHHYRNGEDLYGEQMGAYAGRTELSRDGLSAGRLDLRISRLRPSDDGQYFCTVKNADAYDEATVDLEVSATGADPHISLGGYEDGGVRVLCRSAGWYPLPQLLWRDARGQHLPSVSQTHSQDQEGLFEIEGAVIMTGSMEGPLSCVVRSSRLQQEREFSLHIAVPIFHNTQPWIVALALVLVLLAVSIGLGVYLFRKQAAQSRELAGQLVDQAAVEDEYRTNAAHQSARLQELAADLLRKDSELEEQAEELAQKDKKLVRKDIELEEQAAELVRKDAKIVEQAAELEKQAAEMAKERAMFGESLCLTKGNQAAELAWRNFLLSKNTVKVTLDPDTAHPRLVLLEDNTSMRLQQTWQTVLNTPERFDCCLCVLGREQFTGGKHCWKVELSGELEKVSNLAVGVARASVRRRVGINMCPEEGIWALQYDEGELMSLTFPPIRFSVSPVPMRIWVCLDYSAQQVSFISADDGKEICVFKRASFNGESIHPWFWLETSSVQLCLRDSTPQILSPALEGSCPSPAALDLPLLEPAGAAQE